MYYETEYFDGKNWYPACDFGKVISITISLSSPDSTPEYLTIEDNKKRTTNFCTVEKQKANKYIAEDIAILKIATQSECIAIS